ncbi:ribonuclease D [Parvularcula dongshanensis]|uniref:Ribonuclease D n=1 Tax=Parvularcula dongshanensis TaxID=1173995 RepID=A0A840I4R4_9PROT|nr:ribonuclease D [Parvularcula dongshanensis]MBB4659352.1 ribonuclease D [Parvularcula dongshanensis]
MTIHLHQGDLPDGLSFADARDASVAVDSETLGLNPHRDRLCVVQLCAGDGDAHLVQLPKGQYAAPNLKAVLTDPSLTKIFHFARFDVAAFMRWLDVSTTPLYCTKIASKLVRTYTDRHGLKDVLRETVGVSLDKQQQSSDWGAAELTQAQKEYAASDVLYLHDARRRLDEMLAREGRTAYARACFDFLPTRARLDLAGWAETDIFAHA